MPTTLANLVCPPHVHLNTSAFIVKTPTPDFNAQRPKTILNQSVVNQQKPNPTVKITRPSQPSKPLSAHPDEEAKVQYDTIHSVIELVKKFGKKCLMAKTDIEDAFRIIPIHTECYKFSALQWIMLTKFGAGGMSHMIDDFFFIGAKGSKDCDRDLKQFISLCSEIGVPIKHDKTVLPSTVITIYGIEIDSEAMECRLPMDKVEKIRSQLQTFSKRKKVTLTELRSLLGLLNFASSVICPGRAFLRRLTDLTKGTPKPHYFKVRLNKEARLDIKAWLMFIENFNNKSVFKEDNFVSSDHLKLYTDASGSQGFAGVLGAKWFASEWPSDFCDLQIAIKELFPIVLALEVWGDILENRNVLFLTDNAAVACVTYKQSSKEPIIMRLIRRLVVVCMCKNIHFKAQHIPGKVNVVADGLSRLKFQELRRTAPWLDLKATPIPPELMNI
ncbi:uncharacterized protein LOC133180416 [Saccostrea echinata]|uniref:uncharacterized protein LOC133180416 n=1 Tax=Saccostrea echinata TaxID=191078 RepID=UPI002A7F20B7|nr:uncharacterized protein LOC133180416 [Saccostrea echinata]